MITGLIFDLDLTLIDSKIAEPHRDSRQWQRAYDTIPHFTPYDGMDEVLEFINAQNIPYCIVTSSPSTYCLRVCQHWRIDTSQTVCYHDTAQRKPHPAPITLAVQKLKIAPERILSFGDRDIDITASNAAGVPSVACLWGAENPEKLLAAKPMYILNTPRDIIKLIQGFHAAGTPVIQ